tara:strand:+ start:4421 stop:5137 length:717 start_codon:yes stop_codon:yes gene_type:complete
MSGVGVFSFPRSGTHFLINALTANFPFQGMANIDYDTVQGANFFHPAHIQQLFQQLQANAGHIAKCHFEAPFVADAVKRADGGYTVLYIHRHPAATLNSYRKFIQSWPWVMGPKHDSLVDFMNAAPKGQMLLSMYESAPTILDFWARHVTDWRRLAETRDNVHVVRYEDLAGGFEDEMSRIANLISQPLDKAVPPARDAYIEGGEIVYEDPEDEGWRERGQRLATERYPDLMAELGYA